MKRNKKSLIDDTIKDITLSENILTDLLAMFIAPSIKRDATKYMMSTPEGKKIKAELQTISKSLEVTAKEFEEYVELRARAEQEYKKFKRDAELYKAKALELGYPPGYNFSIEEYVRALKDGVTPKKRK